MKFIFFHRYPFLRLVFPLATGIYVGDELFFRGVEIPIGWGFATVTPLLVLLLAAYFLKSYAYRWLFGVLLFLFFFVGGASWVNVQLQHSVVSFPGTKAIYHAVIVDKPEPKKRSVLCRAVLVPFANNPVARLKSDSAVLSDSTFLLPSAALPRPVTALLYLAKDSASNSLCCGEELLIFAELSLPANKGNSGKFDYARYSIRKGVGGSGYVAAGSWQKLSRKHTLSLRQQALDWRERLLGIYRKLGFREDEFAVLSALTVGYKEELSEEIKESYSVSGASHVLALSGLHIGFLYALLFFCLKGLPDKWKGVHLIRALTIVALLWSFAFFTGLSPSVVRSVAMCSLFALSGAFGRESFSMNTLSAAAFFMLLCQPTWLFDVGFQLSFCAVAAILLLQPGLYAALPVTNRVGKYVWGLLSISLVAQLGTAPLVILYFSRFSTHFLLTNLVVIPLVSVCMYAAVLMLLLTPLASIQSIVAIGVGWLVGALNDFVRWIEHLPWASLDGLLIYPVEAFVFYLALLCLLSYCSAHSSKRLITFLLCILLLGSLHAVLLFKARPQHSRQLTTHFLLPTAKGSARFVL